MSTIFKKIIDREVAADIVYEDDQVLAFLDNRPMRKGHTLVVPKKEFVNIFDGDTEILKHMIAVVQTISHAVIKATGAAGVNIHMNNGEEAGQEVPHAHMHIIPRFKRGELFPTVERQAYSENESAVYAEKIKAALGSN